MSARDPWAALEGRAPRAVAVGGVPIGRGSRVRLRPRTGVGGDGGGGNGVRAGGDVFDLALAGQTAVVESIQQTLEGGVQLAVVLERDPGRDLGVARQPGHRFFFSAEEVEPLGEVSAEEVEPLGEASAAGGGAGAAHAARRPSVLVAGIGNVLLADDGFGVAVAQRLARRALPAGVKVADYGIRGMDLAYELQDDYDAAVLIDAVPRGMPPGTLFTIEHRGPVDEQAVLDVHGMTPVRVLALARALGAVPERIVVVGCEPAVLMGERDAEIAMELSPAVRAAVPAAVELVERLLVDLLAAGAAQDTHEEVG